MQERNEDDYNDFMTISEEQVTGFIEPAAKYLEYVEGLINEYLNNND